MRHALDRLVDWSVDRWSGVRSKQQERTATSAVTAVAAATATAAAAAAVARNQKQHKQCDPCCLFVSQCFRALQQRTGSYVMTITHRMLSLTIPCTCDGLVEALPHDRPIKILQSAELVHQELARPAPPGGGVVNEYMFRGAGWQWNGGRCQ